MTAIGFFVIFCLDNEVGNGRCKRRRIMMSEKFIGILPFISFSDELIKIEEFLIFTDSIIREIDELSESLQKTLRKIAENQKAFMKNNYGNEELKITFIISTSSVINQEKLENFVEIIFFFCIKVEN